MYYVKIIKHTLLVQKLKLVAYIENLVCQQVYDFPEGVSFTFVLGNIILPHILYGVQGCKRGI